MAEEPPKLTVASSRDDAAIERERCSWEIDQAMRELAANILRVICEAGRPWELVDQVVRIREALASAPSGFTVNDANEALAGALADAIDDKDSDLGYAIELIQKGALRKIAAKLLHQHAQTARRDADLWDGIYELERAREALRKKWEAERPSFSRSRVAREKAARALVAGKPASGEPEKS